MVSHSGLAFDHGGHALGRPEKCAKAVSFGTFFEGTFQLEQVLIAQAGLAPRPSGLPQSLGAVGLPGFEPAAGRLPVDAHLAGDLGLAQSSVKEPDGFETPSFQLCQLFCIAFNAFWITHAQRIAQKYRMSLYYAEINKTDIKAEIEAEPKPVTEKNLKPKVRDEADFEELEPVLKA
jgi:hypothetical protein